MSSRSCARFDFCRISKFLQRKFRKNRKISKWKKKEISIFHFFFGLHRGLTIELAFVVLCPYHSASSAAAHCYATLCLFLVSCLFSLEKKLSVISSTNPFL